MKYTMLENGLDFILDAIIRMKNSEDNNMLEEEKKVNLKYALLHISSGIELVLKDRLFKEHWTYIFADMNKSDKRRLDDGSFKSAEIDVVIERLNTLCDIEIQDGDKNELRKLKHLRNRIEHFKIDENVYVVESRIVKALKIIFKFIKENYNEFEMKSNYLHHDEPAKSLFEENIRITEEEEELFQRVITQASRLQKNYEDAVELAKVKATKDGMEGVLMVCPRCNEELLRCGKGYGQSYCHLCGYNEDGDEAAKDYIENVLQINIYRTVKQGGESPLFDCIECGEAAFVYDQNIGQYQCFSCGVSYDTKDISRCSYCGQLYEGSKYDFEICPDCARNIMEKD